jgi:hypothetical protein
MPLNKGGLFAAGDVFIDYPYESVMFRWDHSSEQIFSRFYGEEESAAPVAHDQRLFNDAILFGHEITSKEYFDGK